MVAAHEGLDRIYLRDYKGARAKFGQMNKDFPGMVIGPVGDVLVWQALMLENFDFKFETQYQTASRQARQQLEQAVVTPGNEAWEYFLLAGMLGIESIHTMRHEEYAKALSRGYEAMKAVRKCQELAPDFVDIQLGDGLFDYWATVISRSTKLLPNTGDKRPEGIRQMMRVQERSLFLRAPATLALTFTWIEEGKRAKALESALRNYALYPKNIINNQVLGRVFMYNRKYADAERIFKEVQATDPKNQRSHYYLGRLYVRWGKLDAALASLATYLAFTYRPTPTGATPCTTRAGPLPQEAADQAEAVEAGLEGGEDQARQDAPREARGARRGSPAGGLSRKGSAPASPPGRGLLGDLQLLTGFRLRWPPAAGRGWRRGSSATGSTCRSTRAMAPRFSPFLTVGR